MQSFRLLSLLCDTLNKGPFVTYNEPSSEDELGSIAAFMDNINYYLVVGELVVGGCYLLSDIALYEATPDVIFANHADGGKTSMFGYLIDDCPEAVEEKVA